MKFSYLYIASVFFAGTAMSACATPTQTHDLAEVETETESQSTETRTQTVTLIAEQSTDPTQAIDQNARFERWKQNFQNRAISKGYDPNLVRSLIAQATISEIVIERNENQPEFTRPIWAYVDNAVNETRLNGGREKLATERAVFDAVQNRYFVDRHILTAIWGLESAYGKIMGTRDIVSALATLAFEGRRTEFGEQQLYGLLDMLAKGYVRQDQLVGSWAGAMGMMQFIPTTFRDYAIDFNQDGNKDLWTSSEDALASAAHYLARHGWEAGQPVMKEVILPDGFDYAMADGRRLSVTDWARAGIMPIDSQMWTASEASRDAKLLIPAGHRGPKFLTFKNFDVIRRYNNSTSYVLGITALAEAFQGRNAISTLWPKDDAPLSRTEKETMQRRLTALGYDTKGVDGQIGPNTRRAIRAWQAANGMIADGYVNQEIFQIMIRE